ncbi:MAG: hypothetical protein R3211_03105 [Balneolaceae bacterium]|nr:hypothetical protein [Balneolaceae bacterium]
MLNRPKEKPKYKLAVIGDSVSQGFNNGGIYRTDLSFPALLNHCFDPEPPFQQPLFTAQGGIPLNLEVLVRGMSDLYGNDLKWKDYLPAARYLYSTLKRIKNYWEGHAKPLEREQPDPYQNQSIWGFTLNDTWMITEKKSREYIESYEERYRIFNVLPDHAMYTTARMVLNPTFGELFADHSQIDNIQYLQDNGGIENLILSVGHNNIIGAVTDLRFKYSEESDLGAFPARRTFTVYRPEHFEMEYRKLAERICNIGAENVIVQTIPYVTIPPVTRGINEDLTRREGGYFDYYTRFWIWDTDFDPDRHPHLTKKQAIELDQITDQYNKVIRDVADEYGWVLVPLNRNVNTIARRRLAGNIRVPYPKEFREAMMRYEATKQLVEDPENPLLTTDYIRIDEETGRVRKGGLFSLDGIHPTTIGYGLIAYTYYEAMKNHGIKFERGLDWDFIIQNDTLVTDPPYLLVELRKLLRFLSLDRQEKLSRIGQGVLHQVLDLFSPRRRAEKLERDK